MAHYLEQEGVPTVAISLFRPHTEKTRPPRALWVPFELGRPIGLPDDAAFQGKVVRAALALLERESGPVLEDFPEDAAAPADFDGWACPIPLAPEESANARGHAAALATEVERLRPWHDLFVERRDRTSTGTSGLEIDDAAALLGRFLDEGRTDSPVPATMFPDLLKLACADLMAFHTEAATAQPGEATSRAIADWMWGQTALGAALLALRDVASESDDPTLKVVGTRLIVPHTEQHRRG